MSRWQAERNELWEVTREMVRLGLVSGSNGNASMRLISLPGRAKAADGGSLVLITPAGIPYRRLGPGDLAVIDLEGEPVEGDLPPSTEAATHLTLYRAREDIGAIVHTHSIFASVAAVAGEEIPPLVDEMVIKVGGSVKVAEYGFPSTEELAQRALDALGDRNALLLRNHGLVAVGPTPWEALEMCQLVENVARIFLYASLLEKANTLPPEIIEMEERLFEMQRAAGSTGGGKAPQQEEA